MDILFNFSKRKTVRQAIVLYVFYVFLSIGLGFILAVLYHVTAGTDLDNEIETVTKTGRVIGPFSGIVTFVITYFATRRKGNSISKRIVLSLIAALLSSILSALVGILLPTYLSTRK